MSLYETEATSLNCLDPIKSTNIQARMEQGPRKYFAVIKALGDFKPTINSANIRDNEFKGRLTVIIECYSADVRGLWLDSKMRLLNDFVLRE